MELLVNLDVDSLDSAIAFYGTVAGYGEIAE
jgi:hypothetical protein